jgi:hypothetical protein
MIDQPSQTVRSAEDHQAALTESLAIFIAAAERFPRSARRDRPHPGAFTATEIVYHVLAVEALWQERIGNVLTGRSREFIAMNPDEDAAQNHYNDRSFEDGVDELTKRRIETLATIGRLSGEQLLLSGIHSKYGEMSLHKIFETMEGHDKQHAAQLDRTARELSGSAVAG